MLRGLPRRADPAMKLNGLLCAVIIRAYGRESRARGCLSKLPGIRLQCRERCPAGNLNQRIEIGESMFDCLKCADRLAERTPLQGVVTCSPQTSIRASHLLERAHDGQLVKYVIEYIVAEQRRGHSTRECE